MVKTAKERRIEITSIIQEVGFWNINQSALARKYGVSPVMIHKDLKIIKKRVDIQGIGEISVNIGVGFRKALKEAFLEMSKMGGKSKLEAIKTFNHTADSFTKFLENFGYKEKVAEKLITADVDQELERLRKAKEDLENGNKDD